MKNIIERKIPLNIIYTLIDKQYVSIIDGMGCTCDNCGKLIANIATISNGTKSYHIGFDCLDTILTNNAILSQVDIANYQEYKDAIKKVMKLIKLIKEVKVKCPSLTGILFEDNDSPYSDYHNFYWLQNDATKSRDNDNVKIKGVSTKVIAKIISDYFKQLTILIK